MQFYRFRHTPEDVQLANKQCLERLFNCYFYRARAIDLEVLESASAVSNYLEDFFGEYIGREESTELPSKDLDPRGSLFYLRLSA